MNVLSEWAFIGVFFVLAPALPAVPVILSVILAPSKPNTIPGDGGRKPRSFLNSDLRRMCWSDNMGITSECAQK